MQFDCIVHLLFPAPGMEADFSLRDISVELAAFSAPTDPRGSLSLTAVTRGLRPLTANARGPAPPAEVVKVGAAPPAEVVKVLVNDVDHVLLDHGSGAVITVLTGRSTSLSFPHPMSPEFSSVIEAKIAIMTSELPELQRLLEQTRDQRASLTARRDILYEVRCLNTL